jgi:hypothetical protein
VLAARELGKEGENGAKLFVKFAHEKVSAAERAFIGYDFLLLFLAS